MHAAEGLPADLQRQDHQQQRDARAGHGLGAGVAVGVLTIGGPLGDDQRPEERPRDDCVQQRVDGIRPQRKRVPEVPAQKLDQPQAETHCDPPRGHATGLTIKRVGVPHNAE